MQELNGAFIIDSVTEVRRIKTIVNAALSDADKNANIPPEARQRFKQDMEAMLDTVATIGANAATIAADRLIATLEDNTKTLTWKTVAATIEDVESRFRDELRLVRLFVLHGPKANLFGTAGDLAGWEVAFAFPSGSFEIEEAAKCLALGRATASAFHSMRLLEIGIRALAKHLAIPDPTKPAEKNWGVVLKAIKDAIDRQWPVKTRLPGSEGSEIEALYATLDAVKNPWRNATMHVETIYTEAEAQHILNCVVVFMQKLEKRCDESGEPVAIASASSGAPPS